MKWRAVEFRLLSFYCLLLLALGSAFSMFTVASFDRFEMETVRTDVENRAQEIWAIGSSMIDQRQALQEMLERRFSPAMQNRFIRLTADGNVLYQSASPAGGEFDPTLIPLPEWHHSRDGNAYGNLFVLTMDFRAPDGRIVTIESGQSTLFAKTLRSNLVSSLLLGLPVLLAFTALG